ncbi:MAG: hypothetical protein HOQ22_10595 [Nocardioidaceae bacterium]|nr:hypothetical protein [Nocardioidaceae bacterium]NUS51474.1 hypothetical protein [Nocardioidaceae bacterium]
MAHHGNTPAAWTGVTVILIGFVVGSIGLIAENWVVFWAGVVIGVLVGPIVGKILQVMGLGAEPRRERQEAH